MIEKTLTFVKPRNEDIFEDVFAHLDFSLRSDFEREDIVHLYNLPAELIEKHYVEERASFPPGRFEAMLGAYSNGHVFVAIYSGRDIVKRVKDLTGPTDPAKAPEWTIRGRFRRDSMAESSRRGGYLNNTMHSSQDNRKAGIEIPLWTPYLARGKRIARI